MDGFCEEMRSRETELSFAQCDARRKMKLSAMLSLLVSAAGWDYDARGLTYERLLSEGKAILLSRITLAVSRLPEKARTAVHLYYAEGYSAEEISRLMHIPAATVRTRLHRARKQLKELLGGIDDETCVSRSDGTNFGPQRAE